MRRRTAPSSLPVTRLPFLEGLRAVAALYVVLSHFCSMADGRRSVGWQSHAPKWLFDAMSWMMHGNLAVASFIVLSGFCLQLSLFHRADGRITNLAKFYQRRALRILPPYYAALLLSIATAMMVTQYQHNPPFTRYVPVTPADVAAHALLIHNFVPDWMYKINGVMWSIALEAQLYVLFPLLVWILRGAGRSAVMFLASVFAIVVIAYVPGAPKLYPWYLPQFVAGMVAAHLAFRPAFSKEAQAWCARIIGLVAAYGAYRAAAIEAQLYVQDPLIGVAIACLCHVMTTNPKGAMGRVLSFPPLVWVGAFSYSLYLMHHPILQIVYVNRPGSVNDEVSSFRFMLTTALPIILVGTFLFYLLFERPFLPRRPLAPNGPDEVPDVPLSLPLKAYGDVVAYEPEPIEERRRRTTALFADGYRFPGN